MKEVIKRVTDCIPEKDKQLILCSVMKNQLLKKTQ